VELGTPIALDELRPENGADAVAAFACSEASVVLGSLTSAIITELLANPQYGLEAFLSIKIRHGTLAGQLRKAAQEHNLITQRKGDTNQYLTNDFWTGQLEGMPPNRLSRIRKALNRFSAKYEGLIEGLRANVIQVKSEDNSAGLFDFNISDYDLYLVYRVLGREYAIDDLLDLCILFFWREMGAALAAVRAYLDGDFRSSIRDLFSMLVREAEAVNAEPIMQPMIASIMSAQTDTMHSIDRVREWFVVASSAPMIFFTPTQVAEIAKELVVGFHPEFSPVVSVPESQSEIASEYLLDALNIAIENVWQHSKLKSPRLDITFEFSEADLRVAITSDAVEGSPGRNAAPLAISRTAVQNRSYGRGVSTEGGTGFMKLAQMIELSGLNPEENLSFAFLEDGRFELAFAMRVIVKGQAELLPP